MKLSLYVKKSSGYFTSVVEGRYSGVMNPHSLAEFTQGINPLVIIYFWALHHWLFIIGLIFMYAMTSPRIVGWHRWFILFPHHTRWDTLRSEHGFLWSNPNILHLLLHCVVCICLWSVLLIKLSKENEKEKLRKKKWMGQVAVCVLTH